MDSLVMESRIQPLKEMGTMYKWGSKNKWHIRFTSQARCYSLHKGKDADFTGPCEQSFCRQQQFTVTGTLMMVCDKWITGTLVNAILIKSQSIVGTKLILFRDAYILNHKKKNKNKNSELSSGKKSVSWGVKPRCCRGNPFKPLKRHTRVRDWKTPFY